MNRDTLMIEVEKLRKELEPMNKNTNKKLEDISKIYVALYCLLYSNHNEVKNLDKVMDLIKKNKEELFKLFKDRDKILANYVEKVIARTMSEDTLIELNRRETSNRILHFEYLYKLIKSLEYSDLIEGDCLIKFLDDEEKKTLIKELKTLYIEYSSLISEKALARFQEIYPDDKKYDQNNINELYPKEYDYDQAYETFPEYFPDYDVEYTSDDEEEVFDDDEEEETIEEAVPAKSEGEAEPLPKPKESKGDEESEKKGGKKAGHAEMIKPEDLEHSEAEYEEIIIRDRKEDESIEDYQIYLKELYEKYGIETEYFDDEQDLRKPYPHETGKPTDIIFTNIPVIKSDQKGKPIYNGYEEYKQYTIAKRQATEKKEKSTQELIQYLEKNNNTPGEFIYKQPIAELIEILKQSDNSKNAQEKYSFKINMNKKEVENDYYIVYVAPVNLNKFIKLIYRLNRFEVPFCGFVKMEDEKHHIGDTTKDFNVEKFIADVFVEGQEDKTEQQTQETPVEQPASEQEPSHDKKDEEIRKLREEVENLKAKLKEKDSPKPVEPVKSGEQTVTKVVASLAKFKTEVYQALVSMMVSKELDINIENFNDALQKLYKNQNENSEYKIEYNQSTGDYLVVSDVDGERQTVTISYKGFLRMAATKFEKARDREQEYIMTSNKMYFILNLRGSHPEKVDTTQAIIYSCLTDANISVNSKKLVITKFILQQLAKKQAQVKISYGINKPGINAEYALNFADMNTAEPIELALHNRDVKKPIIISILLKNGETIELRLEPIQKEKQKTL